MLRRRILASSMASVMALSSVAAVAFAADTETTYATQAQLKSYVANMEDKKLDDFGTVSTEVFEKALNYAQTVVANAEADKDEVAVAYLMLKEAEGNLITRDADALKGLISDYAKDYNTNNILNDDLSDEIWKTESWDNFAYYYEEAESALDREDPKDITDAYENLEDAHLKLSKNTEVTKAQFHKMHNELAHLLEKEFDYNAWERVTVSGTGTVFDGGTYAWSVLFYYVASADAKIMEALDSLDEIKTVNKTTKVEIVSAYQACEEAVKVLNAATPAKMKNYSSETSVRNIVLKDYKAKLLGNADFVEAFLKANIDDAENQDKIFLDTGMTITVKDALDATKGFKGSASTIKLSDIVKKNQITVYAFETTPESNYIEVDTATKHAVVAKGTLAGDGTKGKPTTSINLVDNKNLQDFLQVLGTMTEPTKLDSSVWDGDAQKGTATFGVKDADTQSKLVDFASLNELGVASKVLTNWLDEDNGPGGISSGAAAVMNSASAKDTKLAPTIKEVLNALNGNTTPYDGKTALAVGNLDKALESDRVTLESPMISSTDVNMKKLGEKVSAKEWNIIGNYLNVAMSDWLDKAADKTYTVADADALTKECDSVLEEAGDSAVFEDLCDKVSTTRAALVTEANAHRREGKKAEVTTTIYTACETALKNLKTALNGFKYKYEDVAAKIAEIAGELENNKDLAGNATVAADLNDCVLAFIKAGNLLCTDSSEMTDDVLNDSYEFAYYNRIYTADGETTIGDVTIDDAKNGPNQKHYDLKVAYEKLLKDYEAATDTSEANLDYNVDGQGQINTLDAVALVKLIGAGTADVTKYDFDKSGSVNVNDVVTLLKKIAAGEV